MDFLATLLVYANAHGISESEVKQLHQNYCQNLYWQPNAQEKMQQAYCDISATSEEISRVKSGRY